MSLELQKQDDPVGNLITLGKERGYIIYDEVKDVLPPEMRTSAEIKSLFSAFEHHNIHVYENASEVKAARGVPGNAEGGELEEQEHPAHDEEVEIDQTAHLVDKPSDPVRVYLREMGRVPLLKREGEVAIAKRMERGHGLVLRTISRSPLVLKELIAVGRELRNGTRSIREVVHFDEEELTIKKIEKKTRLTLRTIDKIEKLFAVGLKQAAGLNDIPESSRSAHLRARWRLSRTRVEMSHLVRSIMFNPLEKKRLVDKLRHAAEQIGSVGGGFRPA